MSDRWCHLPALRQQSHGGYRVLWRGSIYSVADWYSARGILLFYHGAPPAKTVEFEGEMD